LGGVAGSLFSIVVIYLFWVVEKDAKLRRKADEVLRQPQLVVDNSADAIIGESLEGIITSWNAGATRMLGYAASEVIGKPILSLVPPARQAEVAAVFKKIKMLLHYISSSNWLPWINRGP